MVGQRKVLAPRWPVTDKNLKASPIVSNANLFVAIYAREVLPRAYAWFTRDTSEGFSQP